MRGKLALKVGLVILAVTLCVTFSPERPAQAQSSSAAPSLYKRLGGYDAIAAVTDDFLGRLAADKQMSRFFVVSARIRCVSCASTWSTSFAKRAVDPATISAEA